MFSSEFCSALGVLKAILLSKLLSNKMSGELPRCIGKIGSTFNFRAQASLLIRSISVRLLFEKGKVWLICCSSVRKTWIHFWFYFCLCYEKIQVSEILIFTNMNWLIQFSECSTFNGHHALNLPLSLLPLAAMRVYRSRLTPTATVAFLL